MFVWVFVEVCAHECREPWRPEETFRLSESEVKGDCDFTVLFTVGYELWNSREMAD